MENKDKIKDLFQEKLSGFEANVRPELWTSISSQIGAGTGITGTGLSIVTKTIIGISAAAVVGVGTYLFFQGAEDNSVKTDRREISAKETQTSGEQVADNVSKDEITEKTTQVPSEDRTPEMHQNESISFEGGQNEQFGSSVISNDVLVSKDEDADAPLIPEKKKEETPVVSKGSDMSNTPVDEKTPEKSGRSETNESTRATIDLPNIFTPNGDGVNDQLMIKADGLTDFSVVVLDDMNHIMYQSTDPSFSWNGTMMNGDLAPEGNYVYYVTARDASGNLITKHSVLHLER